MIRTILLALVASVAMSFAALPAQADAGDDIGLYSDFGGWDYDNSWSYCEYNVYVFAPCSGAAVQITVVPGTFD